MISPWVRRVWVRALARSSLWEQSKASGSRWERAKVSGSRWELANASGSRWDRTLVGGSLWEWALRSGSLVICRKVRGPFWENLSTEDKASKEEAVLRQAIISDVSGDRRWQYAGMLMGACPKGCQVKLTPLIDRCVSMSWDILSRWRCF